MNDTVDDRDSGVGLKGGKGSGHWGHVGRPGRIGGSAPSGGGENELGGISENDIILGDIYESHEVHNDDERARVKNAICHQISRRAGVDYDMVNEVLQDWRGESSAQVPWALAVSLEMGTPLSEYQKQKLSEYRQSLLFTAGQTLERIDIETANAIKERDKLFAEQDNLRQELDVPAGVEVQAIRQVALPYLTTALKKSMLGGDMFLQNQLRDWDGESRYEDVVRQDRREAIDVMRMAAQELSPQTKAKLDRDFALAAGYITEQEANDPAKYDGALERYLDYQSRKFAQYYNNKSQLSDITWHLQDLRSQRDKRLIAQTALDNFDKIRDSNHPLRRIARAIYEETQEKLAENGIRGSVVLYRGLRAPNDQEKKLSSKARIKNYFGNVVESWTTRKAVARDYARTLGDTSVVGAILAVRVPVRNIFSLAVTGLGSLPLYETTILGTAPYNRVVVSEFPVY